VERQASANLAAGVCHPRTEAEPIARHCATPDEGNLAIWIGEHVLVALLSLLDAV